MGGCGGESGRVWDVKWESLGLRGGCGGEKWEGMGCKRWVRGGRVWDVREEEPVIEEGPNLVSCSDLRSPR